MPFGIASFSEQVERDGHADTVAAAIRQLLIGTACVAAAAVARMGVEHFTGGLVPFLFTFPAVIAATLLGGARAGWVALLGCQALSYAFVLPHWLRDRGYSQELATFALSTVSAGAAIWATAAFQRASHLLRRQCERQVHTLSLLIAEMDHRTKNNFQIAASLLSRQGLASGDPRLRDALDEGASRLVSIASVYQGLSTAPAEHDLVSLRDHLERICAALRESLLPDDVRLDFGGDDVRVRSSAALPIGLIVNEWVTNAVKYAFAGGGGTVSVRLLRAGDRVRVEVRDDGTGIPKDTTDGVGARLVPSLAEAIDGRLESRSDGGTLRAVTVPLP